MDKKIGFFTAVTFKDLSLPPSKYSKAHFKALDLVDGYFYLGGKKVQPIEEIKWNKYIVESVDNPTSCVLTALKIASYCTILIPLIMLVAKAVLRSRYEFLLETMGHDKGTPNGIKNLTTQVVGGVPGASTHPKVPHQVGGVAISALQQPSVNLQQPFVNKVSQTQLHSYFNEAFKCLDILADALISQGVNMEYFKEYQDIAREIISNLTEPISKDITEWIRALCELIEVRDSLSIQVEQVHNSNIDLKPLLDKASYEIDQAILNISENAALSTRYNLINQMTYDISAKDNAFLKLLETYFKKGELYEAEKIAKQIQSTDLKIGYVCEIVKIYCAKDDLDSAERVIRLIDNKATKDSMLMTYVEKAIALNDFSKALNATNLIIDEDLSQNFYKEIAEKSLGQDEVSVAFIANSKIEETIIQQELYEKIARRSIQIGALNGASYAAILVKDEIIQQELFLEIAEKSIEVDDPKAITTISYVKKNRDELYKKYAELKMQQNSLVIASSAAKLIDDTKMQTEILIKISEKYFADGLFDQCVEILNLFRGEQDFKDGLYAKIAKTLVENQVGKALKIAKLIQADIAIRDELYAEIVEKYISEGQLSKAFDALKLLQDSNLLQKLCIPLANEYLNNIELPKVELILGLITDPKIREEVCKKVVKACLRLDFLKQAFIFAKLMPVCDKKDALLSKLVQANLKRSTSLHTEQALEIANLIANRSIKEPLLIKVAYEFLEHKGVLDKAFEAASFIQDDIASKEAFFVKLAEISLEEDVEFSIEVAKFIEIDVKARDQLCIKIADVSLQKGKRKHAVMAAKLITPDLPIQKELYSNIAEAYKNAGKSAKAQKFVEKAAIQAV